MHLAGLFSIRSMVATAWAWIKVVFAKLSPRGILFVVRKKSHKGDELHVLLSTHSAETVSQLFQGPHASLLQKLPPALGGDCPTAPQVPANPEPLPPFLPAQLTAPRLLDSNESQPRSAKSAMPAKKRRPRPRAGHGPQSSRRMGSGCRGYRFASRRKRDKISC
jgi:hypothetical protein